MKGIMLSCYDGSNNSELALQAAVDMASAFEYELVILNVQPNMETRNARRFFSNEEIQEYEQEMGMRILEKTHNYLISTSIKFSYVVCDGNPKFEINNYADEINAKFIVLGTRGIGSFIGSIIGSVSLGVLHMAHCPVVIVPERI